jgi:pilus assembly protein CpaB
MSKRLISVLLFAFAISAGATVLVYRLVSSRVNAEAKPATTEVMVAARNLPVGTMIAASDLKTGAWSGTLPAGAILTREEAIGRGVVDAVYEGEPLINSRLAVKGAGAGMAATIPPGMRAVAVRVNDVVGVAGFVVPGLRVDVLVLGVPPGATRDNGTITKTVLQNIQVLSAGQNIQRDVEGKPATVQVVNLLVTPEQAEVLSLVSNDMRIQLVLRNPLDTKEVQTSGAAAAAVFTGAKPNLPNPVAAAQPRVARTVLAASAAKPAREELVIPITVEVIHGTKKVSANFKDDTNRQASPEEKQ